MPSELMMQLLAIGYLLAFVSFIYAAARRLKNLLHYFQQEEYDAMRFALWWWQAQAYDRRISLALLITLLCAFLIPGGWEYALAPVLLLLVARAEADPAKAPKKPLVMTARATRIYRVALGIVFIVALALFASALYAHAGASGITMDWLWLALVLLTQMLPDCLFIANLLLKPVEAATQRKFRREAEERLAYLKPTVIGITGSFGKTSTKHFLFHILSAAAPSLMTPGSVNTIMGITRVIREQLRPEHRFFVVEMGDYAPGAVAEKCAFVPPQLAAITAVGIEHFERFKSMDAIARTKFEIADAVWHNGGNCVINATQLDAAYLPYITQPAKTRLITATPQSPVVGALAFHMHDIVQSAAGLSLKLGLPSGEVLDIKTPLYGKQHASNVAVAAVLALDLGVPPSTVVMALATTPQTKHRLEVKRNAASYTVIDDAYNANPEGFAVALDILDIVGKANGGRRIIITPGMVELGTLHDSEHERVGRIAATKADWIIAVAPQRFTSFIAAATMAGTGVRIDAVPTLAAARALLEAEVKTTDVVLFENDLPDLYEQKPSF